MLGSPLTRTFATVFALIFLVDAALGSRAEYFNAYELVRRSFALPWPLRASTFIWNEEQLGLWAYPLAWLVWLAETAAVTGLLKALCKATR